MAADQTEPVIAGPFHLFDGSFKFEILQPKPSRRATTLFRATYKHDHPLVRMGKDYPQKPPLHIHFDQTETFQVLSGRICTTIGWDTRDIVHTSASGLVSIEPYTPHLFYPAPDSDEDIVVIVWAHPDDTATPLTDVFFQNLLRHLSDLYEAGKAPNPLQMMLFQNVTGSSLVMLPGWTFLGPLRWWVPYQAQKLGAAMARAMGMKPALEEYTSAEEWEQYKKMKLL